MSIRSPKVIYKIKNWIASKKPTSTRKGKRCITQCGHCGEYVPQDSRLKFHDLDKQELDVLRFRLKDNTTMHAGTEISTFSKVTDELGHAQFCHHCGVTYQNTLILKVLDIVLIIFI